MKRTILFTIIFFCFSQTAPLQSMQRAYYKVSKELHKKGFGHKNAIDTLPNFPSYQLTKRRDIIKAIVFLPEKAVDIPNEQGVTPILGWLFGYDTLEETRAKVINHFVEYQLKNIANLAEDRYL